MGLFDVNQKMTTRGNAVPGYDPFDEEHRALKAKYTRTILQLGEKFYDDNRDKDMSGTEYSGMFIAINEAENDLVMLEKRRLASVGLRKCESCGAELPINSSFCNKCGARQGELESAVVRASHICPKCGSRLEDGDEFCVSCGYKL